MQEKKRLIKLLDESLDQMRAALEGIDTEKEALPGWTVKDVVAHVADWNEVTTTSLHAYRENSEHLIPDFSSLDEYNAKAVEMRKGLSCQQVLAEWEMAHNSLKTAVEDMPPEKFEGEMTYPWGQHGPISKIVEIMAHHEREHAEDFRKVAGS